MNGAFPVLPEEGHTRGIELVCEDENMVLMAVTLQAHFGQPPNSRENGHGIAAIWLLAISVSLNEVDPIFV